MEDNNEKKEKRHNLFVILGVFLLIVVVAGATYAYYMARVTATFNASTAGYVKLEVNLVSLNTNKKLFPITDTVENLTEKARGTKDTSENFVFVPQRACEGSGGYSACQIYEVKMVNRGDTDIVVNIGVTSLSGATAPNIDVVKMANNTTVTSNTSIKGNATGIVSNLSVPAGTVSPSYYILVFVRNDPNGQTDTGTFSGVVTAATVSGPALSDEGAITAEF